MSKTPIETIRNLGPSTAEAFARAGIYSAEELHRFGPDVAYAKLLEHGSKPHFIAYYCLVLGLQGRPWNDLPATEKAHLRKRFDRIKNAHKKPEKTTPNQEIEYVLDHIGVIKSREK